MKLIIKLCMLFFAAATFAQAELKIFACEPEWGALAQELTKDQADIYIATTAYQDPHHIEARPSLIARIRTADILICTGAELEAGWLPMLLRQGANPSIQPGSAGHFMAADYVQLLEKPAVLDRSLGDIHAAGNPHLHLNPHNILTIAVALSDRLSQLDPPHAKYYAANLQDFSQRWQQAMTGWEAKAAYLKSTPVVVAHKSWIYLLDWLALQEVAALEPKPGIPPSSAYLASLLDKLKQQPARMIIYANYQDPKASAWLSTKAQIPMIELPYTVGGVAQTETLSALFDEILKRLLAVTP